MTQRVYSGWRGVTDKSNNLLAISYEPIEGTLACRFKSRQEPYLYANVPESIYQILLRSPYAGSYFHKHVKGKYALVGENLPPPFKVTPPDKKLPPMREKPTGTPEPQMSLFVGAKGTKKRMKSS